MCLYFRVKPLFTYQIVGSKVSTGISKSILTISRTMKDTQYPYGHTTDVEDQKTICMEMKNIPIVSLKIGDTQYQYKLTCKLYT